MIEINLLSQGKKKRSSRGAGPRFKLQLPDIGGFDADRWVIGAVVVVIGALAFVGLRYRSVTSEADRLTVAVESAAADSARYADLIAQAESLTNRRDSIADKVRIIQEIDADRYIWAHVMDEVARALPDFTWLTGMIQTSGSTGPDLRFRLNGMAGNNFALTRYMETLSASPFIRNVTLVSTEQTVVRSGPAAGRQIYEFALDADYEVPPQEILVTVPLFDAAPTPPQEAPAGDGNIGGGGD